MNLRSSDEHSFGTGINELKMILVQIEILELRQPESMFTHKQQPMNKYGRRTYSSKRSCSRDDSRRIHVALVFD